MKIIPVWKVLQTFFQIFPSENNQVYSNNLIDFICHISYISIFVKRNVHRYSSFTSYRTRFSQVFSYIIDFRKKCNVM